MVLFNAKRTMGFIDDQYGKCRDKESILLPMCSKETISEKKISKGLDSHLDLRAERTNYLQYQETGVSLYLILYSIYYLYTIVGPL